MRLLSRLIPRLVRERLRPVRRRFSLAREDATGRLRASLFDFLFIDGDHSYAGALADLKTYYSLVRPCGLIAFHDIAPDELVRFGKGPRRFPAMEEMCTTCGESSANDLNIVNSLPVGINLVLESASSGSH